MAIVNEYNNTTAIYHGGVSYSSVYKNLVQYFPDPRTPPTPVPASEYIEVEIKATSSWEIRVPTNGVYNWNISIDWWTPVNYTRTTIWGNYLRITGYTADQIYNVVIRPWNYWYGWAKSFSYRTNTSSTNPAAQYLMNIVYDSSYVWYADSATDTWASFRVKQYYWCYNITTPAIEVIPNTVTTIGVSFRSWQYNWCTSLTTTAQEVMPPSVTTIPNSFRYQQYYWCTSLTSSTQEVMPNSVTSIWNNFREYQYWWCTNITSTTPEVLSTSLTTIGEGFRLGQYSNTWVTSWAIEVIPNTVTSIWNSFRSSMYHQCYSLLTIQPEVIPSWATIDTINFRRGMYKECINLQNTVSENSSYTALNNVIWKYFRSEQYYWCTSIISAATETLPSNVTSIWNYFRHSQYYNCTALQTSAAEVFPNTITSVGDYFRGLQYFWCPITSNIVVTAVSTSSSRPRTQQYQYSYNPAVTVKIYWSVVDSWEGAMWLPDRYVQEIQVDSSLISAYQSASNWSYITPSKFTSLP